MADSTSNSSSWSISGDPNMIGIAENYMNQTFQWGMQQFANVSQVTDQVVGDFMNLYGQLSGVGNDLMGMYKGMFMPEYQNLVNDANNYSSAARIQQAMGAAESGVAQDFNGQRNAALASLQSFGIDPSSGRYAALDQTERLQQAAAQAGAGFQAEQATEATGRALRSEALQLGSVLPSQATAAYNAAGQAAGAGANVKMAATQLGSNLLGKPTDWAKIAEMNKQGGSTSSGKSNKDPNSSNRQQSPYGPGGPNQPEKPYNFDPAHGPDPTKDVSDYTGKGGTNSGGGTITPPDDTPPEEPPPPTTPQPPWWPSGMGGEGPPLVGPDGQPLPQMPEDGSQPPEMPEDSGWTKNDTTSPWPTDAASQGTDLGNLDTAGDNNYSNTDFTNSGSSDNPDFTPSSAPDVPDDSGNSTFDQTDASSASDFSSSPSSDTSDFSSDDTEFADGGGIPYSKSPSRGRVTDDIPGKVRQTGEPIRVNAGEWIMPRDVRHWYGDKHLQGMIDKARQGRQAGSAKPTSRPPLPSQRGAIPSTRYGT